MTLIIDETITTLIEIIDQKTDSDEEFNIHDIFQGLTTELIWRTDFGIQTNIQNDPNDKFLRAAKDVFNTKLNKWFFIVAVCLPKANLILHPIRKFREIIKHTTGKSSTGILLDTRVLARSMNGKI